MQNIVSATNNSAGEVKANLVGKAYQMSEES